MRSEQGNEAGLAWLSELVMQSGCHRLSATPRSIAAQLFSLETQLKHASVPFQLTQAWVSTRVSAHEIQQGSLQWRSAEPILSTHSLHPNNGPWLVLCPPPLPGEATAQAAVARAVAVPILSSQQLMPVNNAYERAVLFHLTERFAYWCHHTDNPLSLEYRCWDSACFSPGPATARRGASFCIRDDAQTQSLTLVVYSDRLKAGSIGVAELASTPTTRKKNLKNPRADAVTREPVLLFDALEADAHGTWDARLAKLTRAIARHFAIKPTLYSEAKPVAKP